MTSILINPIEEIHTITSVYINNIFIDIQNQTVSIDIRKLDTDGNIIGATTLIAGGTNFTNIYDGTALIDFVITSLGASPLPAPAS